MTTFFLIRHGEAHYDLAEERRLRGAARDLVPLSAAGVRQIEQTAIILRAVAPELVVSSPMTRALQSAAILSRRLDPPLAVELDLHEWVPDLSFAYDSVVVVRQAQAEVERCGGEWPAGERCDWEPYSSVRQRVHAVLARSTDLARVAVICHGVVIHCLTGTSASLGGITSYALDAGSNSIAAMQATTARESQIQA